MSCIVIKCVQLSRCKDTNVEANFVFESLQKMNSRLIIAVKREPSAYWLSWVVDSKLIASGNQL